MIIGNDKIKTLPRTSGVYLFKDKEGRAIYVGKAANLRQRASSYFTQKGGRDRYALLREKIMDLEYVVTSSEMEALVLESNLIKEYQPRYNVRLKDDKKYPYLEITREEFPRILITRNLGKERGWVYGPYTDVKGLRRILKMLREVFGLRSCHYDLLKKRPRRPCLYYDLKRCSAPCGHYVSPADYGKMVRQACLFLEGKNKFLLKMVKEDMKKASLRQDYEQALKLRDRLRAIEKMGERQSVFSPEGGEGDFWAMAYKGDKGCLNLFRVREGKVISRELFVLKGSVIFSPSEALEQFLGQYYSLQSLLPSKIFTSIPLPQDNILIRWLTHKRGRRVYLSCPRQGLRKRLLELGLKNAQLKLGEEVLKSYPEGELDPAMKKLGEALGLSAPPYRVEGIDISHLRGGEAAGVVTVFENGQPKPDEFRQFRIKFSPTQDDTAMIAEIVERRYGRLLERQIIRPDLILVDGGQGQVRSCCKKLKELGLDIAVVGLAKRFEHIWASGPRPGSKRPLVLPSTGPVLNFLKMVRDEAHRFAQRYHHILRRQKIFL